MKKALTITLMLLISVAFVTTVFAQSTTDKATKAATDAAQEKAKTTADTTKDKATKAVTDKTVPAPVPEKPAKAKMMTLKGEVVKYDEAAKTLVVKDAKGETSFDVAGVKKMPALKAGNVVVVEYAEKDGKKVASFVVTPNFPLEKKELPKAEPAKGKMMSVRGEVVKYDGVAKTLVVKDAKGETSFDVAGVKKLPALKAGDVVMVQYAEKDGKKAASSVITPNVP
jgi:hypothetical protein